MTVILAATPQSPLDQKLEKKKKLEKQKTQLVILKFFPLM
jgi:hypothetical protein